MKKYFNPELIIFDLKQKTVLVSLNLVSDVGNDLENEVGGETLLPKD